MSSALNYQEEFKIRASEVGTDGYLTYASLCEMLQEAAGNHALKLDFDITQLADQNLTWILHRLHLKMDEMPHWRESIIIKTRPSTGDALRAYRDFEIIRVHDKKCIGRVLSYWMLINLDTRRPARMPKEVLELGSGETQHVLPIKTDRLSPGKDDFKDGSRIFTVRYSDLDMNLHLNNSRYMTFIMETINHHGSASINEVDIQFMKECVYNEKLTCKLSQNKKNITAILLNRKEETVAMASLHSS